MCEHTHSFVIWLRLNVSLHFAQFQPQANSPFTGIGQSQFASFIVFCFRSLCISSFRANFVICVIENRQKIPLFANLTRSFNFCFCLNRKQSEKLFEIMGDSRKYLVNSNSERKLKHEKNGVFDIVYCYCCFHLCVCQ